MKIQENDIDEFLDGKQPEFSKGDNGLSETCKVGHEWVVFSTALRDVCLMVQCVNCGAMGSVDDPDEQEWSEAFLAPTRPYRWDDDARVVVRGRGPLCVLKADGGQGEPDPSERSERKVVS